MLTKQQKDIFKAMPAKSKLGYQQQGAGWSKRGGHAGRNSIIKTVKKLEALGFSLQDHNPTSSPDGSFMGSWTVYEDKEGNTVRTRSNYGVTAADNYFAIEASFKQI